MKNLKEEIEKIEREPKEAVEEYVEELCPLFLQAIDEVIGKDETYEKGDSEHTSVIKGLRNHLREEQRERLNQLCGKE